MSVPIEKHPRTEDLPKIKKHETKCYYDCELYNNVFFVVCKTENRYFLYTNPLKSKSFKFLWNNAVMIGFNNREYDSKMVKAFFDFSGPANMVLDEEQFMDTMKSVNKEIISSQKRDGFPSQQKNNHYDAKIGSGKKDRSLKEWQLLLGMSVEESPIPFDSDLDEDTFPMAVDYCVHDVDSTQLLFEKKCMDNFKAIETLCQLAESPVNYGKTIGSVTVDLLCHLSGRKKDTLGCGDLFDYGEIRRRLAKSGYLDMSNVDEVLESIREYELDGRKEIKEAYFGHINVGAMNIEICAGGAHWCSPQKRWENCDDSDVASMYPNIMLAYLIIDRTLGPEGNKAFADMIQTRLKNKKSNPDLASALKIAINSVYGKMSGDGGLNDHSGRLAVCIIGQLAICDLVARYMRHIKDCKVVQVNTDGVIYSFDKNRYKNVANEQMCEWSNLFSMELETNSVPLIYQHNINNYVADVVENGETKQKYKGAFFKSSNGTKEYIYKSLIHFAYHGAKLDIKEFPKTDFIDLVKTRKVSGTDLKYEILVNGKLVPNKLIPFVKTAKGVPVSFRNPADGKVTGLLESESEESEFGLFENPLEAKTIKTLPSSCCVIFKKDAAFDLEPDYKELEKDVDLAIASLKSEMKEKKKVHWKDYLKKKSCKDFLKRNSASIAAGKFLPGTDSVEECIRVLRQAGMSKGQIDKWHDKHLQGTGFLNTFF
jgi:hypothetical protein